MTLPDHDPKRSYKKPVEEVARALVAGRGAENVASDRHWPGTVEHYRDMCAQYPDYREWRSLITDAFRDAEIAIGRMRCLGFLSDLGIAAIRAEEGEGK